MSPGTSYRYNPATHYAFNGDELRFVRRFSETRFETRHDEKTAIAIRSLVAKLTGRIRGKNGVIVSFFSLLLFGERAALGEEFAKPGLSFIGSLLAD